MIRRAIVPIVATCAALAVGIALGAGPLNNAGHADDTEAGTADTAALATANRAAALGQKWAAAAGASLYAGRLTGQHLSLVVLPGADPKDVQGLRDAVAVAKGTVVTTVTLSPTLLEPSQHTMVGTLATKFAQQSQGALKVDAAGYTGIGQVLGLALNGPESTVAHTTYQKTKHGRKAVVTHTTVAASRAAAQETLKAAKLADVSGGGAGDLVLVVLGSSVDATALGQLLDGLGQQATGIVLAGDTASAAAQGTLAAYRAQKHSSKILTVDGDDTVYGRESVALGLVRQVSPQGGDFGASGIDGLVP